MNTSYCKVMLRMVVAIMLLHSLALHAAVSSNILQTKHNLSASNPDPANNVYSEDTTEICVFCHTPHNANLSADGPLWNRDLSSAPSYEMYNADSIDATVASGPLGKSKLCLSCHDGVMDIGKLVVFEGLYMSDTATWNTPGPLTMTNTGPGQTMPINSADPLDRQGWNRNLGTNLTNDHPISFTYDDALANADGELYLPSAPQIYTPALGYLPNVDEIIPLQDGRVECTSCHDPHVYDSSGVNNKFLRKELNKFQALNTTPTKGTFNAGNDILCLGCHDKAGWSSSAHADSSINYVYQGWASAQREFPAGIKLHEAACLNCHDTHSGQGTRKLLRAAIEGALGGAPAQEKACYQCHNYANQDAGNVAAVLNIGSPPPDVGQDFNGIGNITMPITDANQGLPLGTYEPHRIGTGAGDPEVLASSGSELQLGKDFIEGKDTLNAPNRHVECTDCHNPHRVKRQQVFNGTGATVTGTHKHSGFAGGGDHHSNIASGVLAGTWGVEPVYGASHPFGTPPTSYIVKRGLATVEVGASTDVSSPYVTREYQVCLKCHSDYAYGATPPSLGDTLGGTPSATNGLTQFTNQGMEFIAPLNDRGEAANGTKGDAANHRSWHPVFGPTGRTLQERKIDESLMIWAPHPSTMPISWDPIVGAGNPFLPPWDVGVGEQTMYCTDCHGSANTVGDGVVPLSGGVWGPHGSSNNFLLKGTWDENTGKLGSDPNGNPNGDGLCFRCHDVNTYAQYKGKIDQNVPVGNGFESTDVPFVKMSGFSSPKTNTLGLDCSNCGDTLGYNLAAEMRNRNLHLGHVCMLKRPLRCMWCHAAVPHGYKNKQLLIDINDPDPAYGCIDTNPLNVNAPYDATLDNFGLDFSTGTADPCIKEPYVYFGVLGTSANGWSATAGTVKPTWAVSGEWEPTDCGGVNPMKNSCSTGNPNWQNL